MTFPRAIADAQRGALHSELIEAAALVEEIKTELRDIPVDRAHLVALKPDQLAELRQLVSKAHEALQEATQITREETR